MGTTKTNLDQVITTKGRLLRVINLKNTNDKLFQDVGDNNYFRIVGSDQGAYKTLGFLLTEIKGFISQINPDLGDYVNEKTEDGNVFITAMLNKAIDDYSVIEVLRESGIKVELEDVNYNEDLRALIHSIQNAVEDAYVDGNRLASIITSIQIKDDSGNFGHKTLDFILYDEDCEQFNGDNEFILPSGTQTLGQEDKSVLYKHGNTIFSKHLSGGNIVRWNVDYQICD